MTASSLRSVDRLLTPPAGAGHRRPDRPLVDLLYSSSLGIVVMVGPFLWMLLGSLKPQAEFLTSVRRRACPTAPTIDNYERLVRPARLSPVLLQLDRRRARP